MIRPLILGDARRGLALAAGLVLGLALAAATAGIPWQDGAVGLGFGLAAIVGLAHTCSA